MTLRLGVVTLLVNVRISACVFLRVKRARHVFAASTK